MELEPFLFRHEGVLVGIRSQSDNQEVDETLDAVNHFTLRPLNRDEFVVFTLDLCHNQIDRHFSRFPEAELEKINQMVVGRPLMERHDLRGTLPRGTFFRSRLHQEDERISVRPDVYVLRTTENEHFIANIEGGVYRETSMGFSFETPECSVCKRDLRTCDHVPGKTYGDVLCHFVMRNILEVIEGSVVASGSQGTSFVAQERALPLSRALEAARRAYHTPAELWSKPWWCEE